MQYGCIILSVWNITIKGSKMKIVMNHIERKKKAMSSVEDKIELMEGSMRK